MVSRWVAPRLPAPTTATSSMGRTLLHHLLHSLLQIPTRLLERDIDRFGTLEPINPLDQRGTRKASSDEGFEDRGVIDVAFAGRREIGNSTGAAMVLDTHRAHVARAIVDVILRPETFVVGDIAGVVADAYCGMVD